MDDPFVLDYDESELRIASEFLNNWLPFLTRGLCPSCSQTLTSRIHSLHASPQPESASASSGGEEAPGPGGGGEEVPLESAGIGDGETPSGTPSAAEIGGGETPPDAPPASVGKVKMSWADMAQEDELEEEAEAEEGRRQEAEEKGKGRRGELTREKRERIRFTNVVRKKDFLCLERVKGKIVNVLGGLELHSGVFSAVEQNRIVDFVYDLQRKGRNGELGDHTYSEPDKWMRGKGRVTIQFGCCYNYAVDKEKNPPGILRHVVADPVPSLFKIMIKRLVRWHVLPPTCIPNSCIVNIYEPGDCIPPHIDSHDFVRPFCTVSFLSECNIVFGTALKIVSAGEFIGAAAIPLPVGSVLVLNGNGADVAKHCVPSVPNKRISITFRKMDESLHPYGFKPEPDLLDIAPLPYGSDRVAKETGSSGNKNHTTEVRTSERRKDNVESRVASSNARLDLHDRMVHEEEVRRTTRMPSHRGSHHRHHHEVSDIAAEVGGSGKRVGRHVPVSDSAQTSTNQDNDSKPRRQDMSVCSEMQDEHTPYHLSHDKVKPQNESIMRIICMDNKRIVVKSNPDDIEGSSWASPGPEHSDSPPFHSHSLNSRRRRVTLNSARN